MLLSLSVGQDAYIDYRCSLLSQARPKNSNLFSSQNFLDLLLFNKHHKYGQLFFLMFHNPYKLHVVNIPVAVFIRHLKSNFDLM